MDSVLVPINVIYSETITDNGKYDEWNKLKTNEYFEYRRKWTDNPKNFILERFPLNLDIEPTNHCNLRCPFCYRTIAIENGSPFFDEMGSMSLELFKRIIDQVTVDGKCMVPSIKLTHRGEPLINKNIVEMVSIAKAAGAVDVILNTNGTLLTEALSEQLIDAGLDRMLFSFDTPRRELYEQIRVGASFDEVLTNIKNFVKIRNEQKAYGTMVRVGMVITEQSRPYIEEYKALFGDIADVISFNKVHEEIPVSDDGFFIDKDGNSANVSNCSFADSQLWQRMTINWNGDAEICCENYKQEYALGNLNSNTVEEIWNGERFNAVRALHQKGEYWKIPQCRKCTIPLMGSDK